MEKILCEGMEGTHNANIVSGTTTWIPNHKSRKLLGGLVDTVNYYHLVMIWTWLIQIIFDMK
jgi:hypothetical protein